jgi:hypothetical protein
MRNFGEDLYLWARDHGVANVSLEDVDRATTEIIVHVASKRKLRTVMAATKTLVERHYFFDDEAILEKPSDAA